MWFPKPAASTTAMLPLQYTPDSPFPAQKPSSASSILQNILASKNTHFMPPPSCLAFKGCCAPLLQGSCCKLSIFSRALGSVVRAAPLSTPRNGTAQGIASAAASVTCPLSSVSHLWDRAEPRPGTRRAAARQAAGTASSEAGEGHGPRWPLLLRTL